MARNLEAKRRWDAPEEDVVYRWMLNDREEARAAVTLYFGREVFDLRAWRLRGGVYLPTHRGFQAPRSHVPHVIAAGEAAQSAPVLDP